MSAAILHSSLTTSLARYSRSWGLWVLLLIAPVGARLWITTGDDPRAVIAVQGMAPLLTSSVLGVSLGIVVSTLLLPAAFLYLRANTTRIQPWQIEEVTPGSRVAISLGRFAADAAVLMGVLAGMTVAGLVMGWLLVPAMNPVELILPLWLVAAPALTGVAAIRILFDALRFTRGALGELLFFVLWMMAIIVPVGSGVRHADFLSDLTDFTGFVQPLTFTLPPDDMDIAIGSSEVGAKKIALDVMAGILSDGYIASRLAWMAIAVLIAALAGLFYTQHKPRLRVRGKWLAKLLDPGKPRPADPDAPRARRSVLPLVGLVLAEMRLIAGGRLWLALAAGAAALSFFADFRHVASPAAMLLLAFGLSAHAGRSERGRLLALTVTAPASPWLRRIVFIAAGTLWSLLMGLPGIVKAAAAGDLFPLNLAAGVGAAFAVIAITLGTVSRSAFAPRLVLLLIWYGYFSA